MKELVEAGINVAQLMLLDAPMVFPDVPVMGLGEKPQYQVTMSLQVEMLNVQKEMVHVQFLVDNKTLRSTGLQSGEERKFFCQLLRCIILSTYE